MPRDLETDGPKLLQREVTMLGHEESVSIDSVEMIFDAQIRMRFGELISRAASKS